MIELLQKRLHEYHGNTALISNGILHSYENLSKATSEFVKEFEANGIGASALVVIIGDFSLNSVSTMLACILIKATVVPVTVEAYLKLKSELDLMQPDFLINTLDNDVSIKTLNFQKSLNNEWRTLLPVDEPGLIVFTSGSTGTPKAILHSVNALCYRYRQLRRPLTSICFLKFDHMGGFNTILAMLFRGGTAVMPSKRDPEVICKEIEKYKVNLLPATPSFLTQLLMSKAIKRYDLSSLEVISYGTEVMSETILLQLNRELPLCKFKQTYGLSETGVFQIKSKSNSSLWFKFIDPGVSYKVEDNILWIKTESNLLGKLIFENNLISIIHQTDDWFCTEDIVEVSGEYLWIKSRSSDIVNIGGLKVYPAEVENCILKLNYVKDVTVLGETNPILGQMLTAHICVGSDIDKKIFEKKIKKHCFESLEKFKIPSKFIFSKEDFVNDRFKKVRKKL